MGHIILCIESSCQALSCQAHILHTLQLATGSMVGDLSHSQGSMQCTMIKTCPGAACTLQRAVAIHKMCLVSHSTGQHVHKHAARFGLGHYVRHFAAT